MDAPRFDAWTRRRVGVAVGGFAASLVARVAPDGMAGKTRQEQTRRCTKLGAKCEGEKPCCKDRRCDTTGGQSTSRTKLCCKTKGACRFNADCCRKRYCDGQACRACKPITALCGNTFECCAGLVCESGKCAELPFSDRALKDNFAAVDAADMLRSVRDLPISTWNYTADDPNVRHIGPMAQDFAALFGVGADDRHIHPIDGQGVALAAIQGLLAQTAALQEDNARLAARLAALERAADFVQ